MWNHEMKSFPEIYLSWLKVLTFTLLYFTLLYFTFFSFVSFFCVCVCAPQIIVSILSIQWFYLIVSSLLLFAFHMVTQMTTFTKCYCRVLFGKIFILCAKHTTEKNTRQNEKIIGPLFFCKCVFFIEILGHVTHTNT